MSVDLLPEYTAGRIVEIQEQLHSRVLLPKDREKLIAEQSKLWDEAFPGQPYEEIRKVAGPFLLAA